MKGENQEPRKVVKKTLQIPQSEEIIVTLEIRKILNTDQLTKEINDDSKDDVKTNLKEDQKLSKFL